MISLRPMRSSDESKIEAWASAIGSDRFMSRYRPHSNTALCRIIQQEDQDIGYLWIEKEAKESREGVLGILIGEERCWSKGIGRKAIDLIIAEAMEILGIHSVVLRVRSDNTRAYQCYIACGFITTEHGQKLSPTGEVIHFMIMQRKLPIGWRAGGDGGIALRLPVGHPGPAEPEPGRSS
jgi:RimJ/RimL family protein N-acetyltransferase